MRPYYIPPSIGEPVESGPAAGSGPNSFGSRGNATNSSNYASKARDMFTDLDYNDYLGEAPPSMVQSLRDLLDELLWKYTSVLMAQPFEVAKTILQVRDQDDNAALPSPQDADPPTKKSSGYGGSVYGDVRSSSSS